MLTTVNPTIEQNQPTSPQHNGGLRAGRRPPDHPLMCTTIPATGRDDAYGAVLRTSGKNNSPPPSMAVITGSPQAMLPSALRTAY